MGPGPGGQVYDFGAQDMDDGGSAMGKAGAKKKRERKKPEAKEPKAAKTPKTPKGGAKGGPKGGGPMLGGGAPLPTGPPLPAGPPAGPLPSMAVAGAQRFSSVLFDAIQSFVIVTRQSLFNVDG